MRRRVILVACLAAAGCGGPPAGTARAPVAPVEASPGLPSDEARRAASEAKAWFARPRAGEPGAAARAIAGLEHLAEDLPENPRSPAVNPRALNRLQIARREARTALGIPRDAEADAVLRGLRDASRALAAHDRDAFDAALPSEMFTLGPRETLRRLAAPPRVPSARPALAALGGLASR